MDLRYRRTCSAALKCVVVGLALNLESLDTANVISGLVKTARWLREPVSS